MTRDWLISCAAGALFAAGGASAQTNTQAGDPPAATEAAAAPESQPGDIIVTAQRRAQNLQTVPLAITAYTGNQLAASGVRSTRELTQITPSLNFTQSSSVPQATIRGVGTRGVGAGDESVVPIYVDGVYQPFIFAAISDIVGIDRVEVLRGPQSALYGRNATGGAINFITRDPLRVSALEAQLRYGRFNETDGSLFVATGGDTIGTSLAARWRRDDGYTYDPARKTRGSYVDNVSLRSKTSWKPTDALRINLIGQYQSIKDATQAIRPTNGNTLARRLDPNVLIVSDRYRFAHSFDSLLRVETANVAATSSWDLGPVELNLINSYTYGKVQTHFDNDATPLDLASTRQRLTSSSYYNELYLTSQTNSIFSYTVGGVYYSDSSRAAPNVSITTSITGPTTGQSTSVVVTSRVKTDSLAGYGQVEIAPTKGVSLTLGARYTSEKKTFVTGSVTTNLRTNATSSFAPPGAEATFSKFTPTATIAFQPSSGFNIYGRVGKGFKSGIFNTATTTTVPVRPEGITQYEIGVKTVLSPTLRINLAGYRSDQTDVQLNARDPVTNSVFLQNAAATRIWGAEMEVFWRPVRNLNVRLNGSFIDGTYTSFPNASVTIPTTAVAPTPATACVVGTGALLGGNRSLICDVTGATIIRTPNILLNFGLDYTIPFARGKMVLSGNAFHSGRSYWDPLNRLREPPATIVNVMANWIAPGDRYEIGVGADNLFNEYRHLSVVTSATTDQQSDARPFSWYVQLRAKF